MAQQGGGGGSGEEYTLLIVAVGIVVITATIYYFFKVQIITGLFWIKSIELHGLTFFIPKYQDLLLWMKNTSRSSISLQELQYLSYGIGHVLVYPFIIVSVVLAAILYLFHPDSKLIDTESMTSLASKLNYEFPSIKVTEGIDLINAPVTKGPWAMGQTPVEFAKKHKLLLIDPETRKPKVDALKSKLVFTSQLGPLWQGHKHLKPNEKAMYTIFAMYILDKREEADKLLEDICLTITPKKLTKKTLNFSLVDRYYKAYCNNESVLAVVNKHAFKYTVLTGMLEAARKTGIVSNALFLWLKPTDRLLWYVLNNVGRKAVYIEASAVHAQYLAESVLGFAIKTPMIDEVVTGLEEAIQIRIIEDIK